ncbi:MAG: hypothetical protein JWN84_4280 [Nocardioides sp.]|nr:hypothetical protein [Nocardioides sp.]
MTRRLTLALAGGVVTALVAVPTPAHAAPRATDDAFAVYAGGTYTIDPIANDESVFSLPPTSGPLTLCGLGGVDVQRVYVEQVDDTLVVEVSDVFAGTTQIAYEVCQGNQRDAGVITLTVRRLRDLRGVKKRGTRGKVVFSNANSVPVSVTYGSAQSGRRDATRTVAPSSSITVSTARRSIYWLGVHDDGGVVVTVGDGVLTGLQARR